MKRVSKEFSQDFDIFAIITSELKLATLNELQTIYDVQDMYDILEVMDAYHTLTAPTPAPKTKQN